MPLPGKLFDFIPSPNFKARRRPVWAPQVTSDPASRAAYIDAIVVHHTGSLSLDGTIDWFKRRESEVSAHYVVGRDGRIVQMVQDENAAWHAGRSAMFPNAKPPRETDVNQFSLGIELVGTNDSGFTDRQLAALYELLARLVQRYHVVSERVVGHCHIAPGRKIDPDGYDHQFPWAKTREICQAAYNPIRVVAVDPPTP